MTKTSWGLGIAIASSLGCAAAPADRPLTPAEKERLVAEHAARPSDSITQRPGCAMATGAVRLQARQAASPVGGSTTDGFDSRNCPPGSGERDPFKKR